MPLLEREEFKASARRAYDQATGRQGVMTGAEGLTAMAANARGG